MEQRNQKKHSGKMINKDSRTKSSVKIASSSMLYRILSLAMNFVTRTVFIRVLGEQYLGLNSLFLSILNVLSLTELGFGSAITFYLYAPAAENDIERIKSLMDFFKKAYFVTGLSILGIGMLLLPFLKYLVNMETQLPVNLYLVYGLSVLNPAVTYMFFSYVQVLAAALQKNYIINLYNIIFLLITTAACSAALVITKNYTCYLCIRLIISLLNNYAICRKTLRMCPYLESKFSKPLNGQDRQAVFRDVRSIFLFKVTTVIANSADNLILSVMFGTVLVGYNANYEMIMSNTAGFVSMIIYSFASNVGNLSAMESIRKKKSVFRELDLINYLIAVIAFSGIYHLCNPFMQLWLKDEKFLFSDTVVFVKAFVMFQAAVLNCCFVFRESMGLFQYGRYRNLANGFCNLILTVILAKKMGILGVFLATAVSAFMFSEFVFPKIVFQYGFGSRDAWKEQLKLGFKLAYAVAVVLAGKVLLFPFENLTGIMGFAVKGLILVPFSILLAVLPFIGTDEFHMLVLRCTKIVNHLYKKRS